MCQGGRYKVVSLSQTQLNLTMSNLRPKMLRIVEYANNGLSLHCFVVAHTTQAPPALGDQKTPFGNKPSSLLCDVFLERYNKKLSRKHCNKKLAAEV